MLNFVVLCYCNIIFSSFSATWTAWQYQMLQQNTSHWQSFLHIKFNYREKTIPYNKLSSLQLLHMQHKSQYPPAINISHIDDASTESLPCLRGCQERSVNAIAGRISEKKLLQLFHSVNKSAIYFKICYITLLYI